MFFSEEFKDADFWYFHYAQLIMYILVFLG